MKSRHPFETISPDAFKLILSFYTSDPFLLRDLRCVSQTFCSFMDHFYFYLHCRIEKWVYPLELEEILSKIRDPSIITRLSLKTNGQPLPIIKERFCNSLVALELSIDRYPKGGLIDLPPKLTSLVFGQELRTGIPADWKCLPTTLRHLSIFYHPKSSSALPPLLTSYTFFRIQDQGDFASFPSGLRSLNIQDQNVAVPFITSLPSHITKLTYANAQRYSVPTRLFPTTIKALSINFIDSFDISKLIHLESIHIE